jgi:hypothetical protein
MNNIDLSLDMNALVTQLLEVGDMYGTVGFTAAKQAVVANGLTRLVFCVPIFIISTLPIRRLYRTFTNDPNFQNYPTPEFFGFLGCLLGISISLYLLPRGLMYLLASDWYAIEKLLTLVL